MSSPANRLADLIDGSALVAIAPRVSGARRQAQSSILAAFGQMLPRILSAVEATTELRIDHLLAQAAHESDGFCTLSEYASGKAYEGRADLGNSRAGDGVRFKGRGLIQLTGRTNYRAFTIWMRGLENDAPDFAADPDLVATWPWAGWALACYWSGRPALNAAADRDDLVTVTRIVNGGRNGLEDRARYLARAKAVVIAKAAELLSADRPFAPLRRGMEGQTVEELQRALQAAGHYLLSIDAAFGAGTEGAVKTFQRARGLVADGIVGACTAAALSPYWPKEDGA